MKQESKAVKDKTQPIMTGGKKSAGVTSESMKKEGRNLARANYQKRKG